MEERAVGQEVFGREGQHCDTFFYTDDGLVASTDPEFLQGYFDTLTGIFNIVRLREN